MPSDAPPSYESVVARLEQRLGSNPKPQEVIDAVNQLPQYEIDILVANAGKIDDLKPIEDPIFHAGMVKTMSTPSAASHLTTAAADAAAACNAIETMFTNSLRTLTTIDAKYPPPAGGPFAPRFRTLNQAFRGVVHNSKDLAIDFAVDSHRFDAVLIPMCNDKTLTTEFRTTKIQNFINDVNGISTQSDDMHKKFDKLKVDFAVFTGSFRDWAFDKEDADTKELEQARKDLENLKSELSSLETTFFSIGSVATFTLPVISILATMPIPYANYVIVGGLIIAGLSAVATAALASSITSKKGQIESKQTHINALAASISDIKATREKLKTLGENDLTLFNKNISILSLLWNSVIDDARRIKRWLESGANDADMPHYMKTSINEAVIAYKAMSNYLNQYANGISSVNIPKPDAL
ncbi:hypothetical protein DFH11DRAFT_1785784 [Phellopilus nigrolimitatus]|nr:hypothetical protein DFH11DRAFT_1785784 [Phellopilus nigrolimitatus]